MQSQNQATFSIVVPLFNEEQNVNPLVQSIFNVVGANPQFLELILVDDGSTDSTVSLAQNLANDDDRIWLIQHETNKGLGGAIRTGLNAAQGDFVLYTDADLPFDFSLIPQLISQATEKNVVTGYRLNRGEGVRRWILTLGYNFMIWFLFGLNLKDVNFACKIFPKNFIRKAELNSEGSFIDVEMLLESRRQSLEIVQYPMVYYPRERGLSTRSRPKVIFDILNEMLIYKTDIFSKHTPAFYRSRRFLQKSLNLKTSE